MKWPKSGTVCRTLLRLVLVGTPYAVEMCSTPRLTDFWSALSGGVGLRDALRWLAGSARPYITVAFGALGDGWLGGLDWSEQSEVGQCSPWDQSDVGRNQLSLSEQPYFGLWLSDRSLRSLVSWSLAVPVASAGIGGGPHSSRTCLWPLIICLGRVGRLGHTIHTGVLGGVRLVWSSPLSTACCQPCMASMALPSKRGC